MSSLYGNYTRTRSYSEIYSNSNDFITEWFNSPFASTNVMSANDLELTYFILLSNFANSHIVSSDENRFKLELMSLVFRYAPSWIKRIDLQKKLRGLTDDELMQGSKNIYNHAFNPSAEPPTSTLDEINYINEQNTNNFKKSKMDAYQSLYMILETDVTAEFIKVFKKLFRTVVEPESPLWYTTDIEEE